MNINLFSTLFILAPGLACAKPISENRPNIIFILTDDHRADALGYTGNQIIRTPVLDKMAHEGIYFKNAFVTTPICAASRASILTGLYERTHGYTFQQGDLKEPFVGLTYPMMLKENGYHVGFFGKLGVNIKRAERIFDEIESYDRDDKSPNRKGYFYKTIEGDTVHLTRYTGYKAQEFIKREGRAGRPFCLSLSFSAPHAHDPAPEQYFWQKKSDQLYADVTIPSPVLGERCYFDALPKEVREGYNRLRWSWRFDTPEKYQQSVKGYYRMISEVDDEIGALLALLGKEGIAENTILLFMGDNGYFLGERQLADKWLMYDQSLRVPMMIYQPGLTHREVSDMVLNIDIPKTILDLARVKAPANYQGKSLKCYLEGGKPRQKRESILFEHLWKIDQIPSSEGIRTSKWKYFRYRYIVAPEELYDLEKDPLETKNLAQDPTFKTILDHLRSDCDEKVARYTRAKKSLIKPGSGSSAHK